MSLFFATIWIVASEMSPLSMYGWMTDARAASSMTCLNVDWMSPDFEVGIFVLRYLLKNARRSSTTDAIVRAASIVHKAVLESSAVEPSLIHKPFSGGREIGKIYCLSDRASIVAWDAEAQGELAQVTVEPLTVRLRSTDRCRMPTTTRRPSTYLPKASRPNRRQPRRPHDCPDAW